MMFSEGLEVEHWPKVRMLTITELHSDKFLG